MKRKYQRLYPTNLVRHRLKCIECPKWFNSKRSDQEYCSNACKCRAARARKAAQIAASAPEFRPPSAEVLEKAKRLLDGSERRK